MTRSTTTAFASLALVGMLTAAAPAQGAACDDPAAGVVFKDMLYGIGIGTILSGLYLISSSSDNDNGKVLGRGALVGGLLGTGAGIYEVAVRQCDGMVAKPEGARFLTTVVPTAQGGWQPGYGVSWSTNL